MWRVRTAMAAMRISGAVRSVLRDQKKSKDVLNVNIPVVANLKVGDVVVKLPGR